MVSLIIPTLNESARVEALADALCQFPDGECIFADGGSTDGTQAKLERLAERYPNCRWIDAPKGRGRQMNAGAQVAKGKWLLFLHADTDLPTASYQHFLALTQSLPLLSAGAFTFRIAHERKVYRYLEWYVAQRCRWLKLPFGDQAIFARHDVFKRLGGYREDFPLMEDVEFVERVNKDAGFRVIEAPVFTSARRYESEGYWRRAYGNVYLQVLYRLGVHPERLAKRYYR
jgi:rSAM/selenodomain-associated transferase 2